jgi:hypothetical protein
MTPLPAPWNFTDVLTNLILAACVLIIVGCAVAFVLAILGWDKPRRPRVETRADLGRVPLTRERVANFLDLEGRRED